VAQRRVERDAVEPGGERLADRGGMLGKGEEAVLRRVHGAGSVAQDAQAGAVDQASMLAGKRREGVGIAVAGVAVEERGVVHGEEERHAPESMHAQRTGLRP
jgi:hypothetical protein